MLARRVQYAAVSAGACFLLIHAALVNHSFGVVSLQAAQQSPVPVSITGTRAHLRVGSLAAERHLQHNSPQQTEQLSIDSLEGDGSQAAGASHPITQLKGIGEGRAQQLQDAIAGAGASSGGAQGFSTQLGVGAAGAAAQTAGSGTGVSIPLSSHKVCMRLLLCMPYGPHAQGGCRGAGRNSMLGARRKSPAGLTAPPSFPVAQELPVPCHCAQALFVCSDSLPTTAVSFTRPQGLAVQAQVFPKRSTCVQQPQPLLDTFLAQPLQVILAATSATGIVCHPPVMLCPADVFVGVSATQCTGGQVAEHRICTYTNLLLWNGEFYYVAAGMHCWLTNIRLLPSKCSLAAVLVVHCIAACNWQKATVCMRQWRQDAPCTMSALGTHGTLVQQGQAGG